MEGRHLSPRRGKQLCETLPFQIKLSSAFGLWRDQRSQRFAHLIGRWSHVVLVARERVGSGYAIVARQSIDASLIYKAPACPLYIVGCTKTFP